MRPISVYNIASKEQTFYHFPKELISLMQWISLLFKYGIVMGVATYDNIGTKDIIDQMPTQEQINRQIDLAEAEFRKRN